jgi:hypothetical protein
MLKLKLAKGLLLVVTVIDRGLELVDCSFHICSAVFKCSQQIEA